MNGKIDQLSYSDHPPAGKVAGIKAANSVCQTVPERTFSATTFVKSMVFNTAVPKIGGSIIRDEKLQNHDSAQGNGP